MSLDRKNGEVLAAVRMRGHEVMPVIESRGDRLLAIVKDRHDHGYLLVLDQSTLEAKAVIPDPGNWFVGSRYAPRILATDDGSISLVPAGISGPFGGPPPPRSLVVTWGEDVGVHWLDAPADLTADGRVIVARERTYEGGYHQYRIEEWRP